MQQLKLGFFLSILVSFASFVSPLDIQPKVAAKVGGSSFEDLLSSDEIAAGRKFLIGSFPSLRQVAYTVLPDNVWRPLVLGVVASPTAIAVDSQNQRLYVSDPPNAVIWSYKLHFRRDGLLQTVGQRRAAVENYTAHWLAVNGVGDLYFNGHHTQAGQPAQPDSVWRQDSIKIATGDSFTPVEVYSRSNTGMPYPKAWKLSGLAVDSFHIYWGNQGDGTKHGAVCKGTRMNIGLSGKEQYVKNVNSGLSEVRGIATTGTELFWLSQTGVYGMSKGSAQEVMDPNTGRVAGRPTKAPWSPMSLAWDGGNLLYFTDVLGGAVYTLPSQNTKVQNMTQFSTAPNIQHIAILLTKTLEGRSSSILKAAPMTSAIWILLFFALHFLQL
eukprot:TRINITY_DN4776_c3_g1_i1.p1 TRINITY_DN4776_c3_g1~~TRINITY_DN4776_c3_g1_i1.p1  ORF type:complete len:383 (+),score=48.88 TRINITY_DN4776_c3_g1_i1:205-1353(+)